LGRNWAQNGVHLVGCFALHLFEEMAVGVHRQLDRGMPEQFLNRLGVNALGNQD